MFESISRKHKSLILTAQIFILVLVFSFGPVFSMVSYAAEWVYPSGSLRAEAACVIDAETGTVLYGKNQNVQYYPASITKIMTALLTLEHCSLDEEVTVQYEAVTNLERGATTAGLSTGDVLTVEDLLYALLLRSANDAANVLAIYIAGSIDDFCVMMNEKALEVGCKNTDFHNPNGLTNSAHLTTAYDMSMILRECIKNETFLEIESHDSYKLAPTANYPGGLTVTMGHRMLRSGTAYSDSRVIAGKTGFTSASGNTLVTAATDGERTVIICVLKDVSPQHYYDTASLLDFGLSDFVNVDIDDITALFDVESRLIADTVITGKNDYIFAEGSVTVTLPKGYDESGLTVSYDYNLTQEAPELSIARVNLKYAERTVGSVYVLDDRESEVGVVDVDSLTPAEVAVRVVSVGVLIAVAATLVFVLCGGLKYRDVEREREKRRRFLARKRRRLKEMGMTEAEFDRYMALRRRKKELEKRRKR